MIGKILKKARLTRKKSQKWVAGRVGVSPELIRRVEVGLCWPSGKVLEQILKAVKPSPEDEIVCWEELAAHQLDEETRQRLVLYAHGNPAPQLPPRVAETAIAQISEAAVEWIEMFYSLTAREKEDLRKTLETAAEVFSES